MAKSTIILASALCFLSLLASVYSDDRFFVEGRVYCDTCRAQFITKLTEYIEGATVKLECRDREGGNLTYSTEAATNKTGTYSIPVDGDHENEICDVALVKSSRDDCSEISHDLFLKKTARISLTKNNGIATPVRLANPLGFLKKVPLPECKKVLLELGITASDLE